MIQVKRINVIEKYIGSIILNTRCIEIHNLFKFQYADQQYVDMFWWKTSLCILFDFLTIPWCKHLKPTLKEDKNLPVQCQYHDRSMA